MTSKKLKTLFLISVPIFIAHGIEEYLTGFYNTDPISRFVFHFAEGMTSAQATFLTFQIMWWLLLVVLVFIILQKKWQLYLLTLLGLIFIFELHHIVKTVLSIKYYPGLITGLAFPIVGFFYWKELIRNWKGKYDRN